MLAYAKDLYKFLRWPLIDNERVISSIDGFISVSKATREIHQRNNASLSRKPIEVIYNPSGVADDRWTQNADAWANSAKRTLCYVDLGGSVHKGPHVYLQAVRILQAKGLISEARLIGCRNTWVERYASRIGIRENLAFYGKLPRNEVIDLMDSSSIVVVPSIWPEPLGRVAIEANSLGVPVVASRIGGLPEIVLENRTGMLATPGSPSDFAQKIENTLGGSFPREYVSQKTKERFKPDVIADKFINFLEEFAPNVSRASAAI
jgi:glycosyltransferase involved in cell wall biosynthesis